MATLIGNCSRCGGSLKVDYKDTFVDSNGFRKANPGQFCDDCTARNAEEAAAKKDKDSWTEDDEKSAEKTSKK